MNTRANSDLDFAGRFSLSKALRLATQEAHKALEATSFSKRLLEGNVDTGTYVSYLGAMNSFHSSIESAAEKTTSAVVRDVWHDNMRRSADLKADLDFFNRHFGGPTQDDRQIHADFGDLASGNEIGLIGVFYVSEGSRLGGMLLRDRLQAGHPEWSGGLQYFSGSPKNVNREWRSFRSRLDALDLTSADQELALQGAVDGFQLISRAFASL